VPGGIIGIVCYLFISYLFLLFFFTAFSCYGSCGCYLFTFLTTSDRFIM
jgi:hypothetical protein